MMTDKYIIHWNTLIRPSRKSYESKKKTRTPKQADAQKRKNRYAKRADTKERDRREGLYKEVFEKHMNSDGTVDINEAFKDEINKNELKVERWIMESYYDNNYNPKYDVKYGFVFLYFILVGIEKMN